MTRIFISYSRIDEPFARKITEALTQAGVDVWLDSLRIPAGIKWSSAIQDALISCDLMVLILSPDSMSSSNVEDEWQYFLDHKKPLIPLLYQQTERHFQLNRLQYIDFVNQSFESAFAQLELALKGSNVEWTALSEKKLTAEVTPEEHFAQGQWMAYVSQYDEAIKHFDAAIQQRSDYAEAYSQRGYCHEKVGQRASAIWDYQKALQLKPELSGARERLEKLAPK
jgi:tetratricopeptide (TPR) repeat protein